MSNEITVRSGLFINKRSGSIIMVEHNKAREFRNDMTGNLGPTPGALAVPVGGVVVDLSHLTTPGFCQFENLDDDEENSVEVCIYDPQTTKTYPFIELGAGESYVVKLSSNLLEEYAGTGTGTTAPTNQLLLRAANAVANCAVLAFER